MINSENQHIKLIIKSVFNDICLSKSISDLEKILVKNEIEKKYWIKDVDYPKLEFSITKSEIQKIQDESYIINNIFNSNKIGEVDNTIAKLLYAMAWKNGDLKKIKHIIQGIKDVDEVNASKNDGLVFYQFGKYLTKKEGEPIIDQHVLRAFKIYQRDINNEDEMSKAINLTKVTKNEIELIKEYKDWLISDKISSI